MIDLHNTAHIHTSLSVDLESVGQVERQQSFLASVCLSCFQCMGIRFHVWICAVCMTAGEGQKRRFHILELKLWITVIHHLGTGNLSQVFWKKKCSFQASHSFSRSSMVFWPRLRLIATWLCQTKWLPVKYCEDVPSIALQIVSAGYAVHDGGTQANHSSLINFIHLYVTMLLTNTKAKWW